ncbi:proline dehydrogenase family protein [Nocardioides sp. J54]|uniref:proline dehydrogenase family protein n=1 Tax=Nocardioides sp. J54 TaxID=935866 RepID=UPI000491EE9A|nr:proline dehydrogenase family protein [Nocardioides sp. J54]
MRPVRSALRALSRSAVAESVASAVPVPAPVVRAFVPAADVRQAVAVAGQLTADDLACTVAHLGRDARDEAEATATVQEHRVLLDRVADAGLGAQVDVVLRPAAVGLHLPGGEALALTHARQVCRTAARAGVTVTLDSEDHASTDVVLALLGALRADFPDTGVVLRAHLRRTEDDCRALAGAGSRVLLAKGARDEPADVAITDPAELDRAWVRCLKVLLDGEGQPVVATHDPRLVEITIALASRYGRAPGTYDLQLPYDARTAEVRRLVATGERVRVHLPWGPEWYGHVARRLAEHPRNLSPFLTSLVPKK